MSPKRSRTTSRSRSRGPRKRNGYRSRSKDRSEKRKRSVSRNKKRSVSRERKQRSKRSTSRDTFDRKESRRVNKKEKSKTRSRSRNNKAVSSFRDEIMKKLASEDDTRSKHIQRNDSAGRTSRNRRSESSDHRQQSRKIKPRSRSPQQSRNMKPRSRSPGISKTNSIQEKLLKLAQKSPDLKSKPSNFSALRKDRSRSMSNNNIKNPNKVPLPRRDRPVSRDKSRSRGNFKREEIVKGNKRRSRSNPRTISIQEKLLMLSQNQAQPTKAKETFVSRRKSRSTSRDPNKNPNRVPIVRKDRNQRSGSKRSSSRSRIKGRSNRSRSRSVNRISRARDFQSKSPVRKGRTPPVGRKPTKDLSQINNRLFNLVNDQYGNGVQNRKEPSEDKHEIKEKHKKDKKKKKKKKKKKSSSSESDDSEDSLSHKKKKKKKEKKKKKKVKRSVDAVDELNASIAEIEEKTRKVPLSTEEKEERDRRAPMTKEMWDKKQAVVRREFDSDTGRVRLVKGSGEIMEECVSKDRQREINRQATAGDGAAFQRDIKSRLGVKARLY